jgi:hypothetical protein
MLLCPCQFCESVVPSPNPLAPKLPKSLYLAIQSCMKSLQDLIKTPPFIPFLPPVPVGSLSQQFEKWWYLSRQNTRKQRSHRRPKPRSKRSRISCSLVPEVSNAPNPDDVLPYAEFVLLPDLETPRSKSLVPVSNALLRPELVPYRLLLLPVDRDVPSPTPIPCP